MHLYLLFLLICCTFGKTILKVIIRHPSPAGFLYVAFDESNKLLLLTENLEANYEHVFSLIENNVIRGGYFMFAQPNGPPLSFGTRSGNKIKLIEGSGTLISFNRTNTKRYKIAIESNPLSYIGVSRRNELVMESFFDDDENFEFEILSVLKEKYQRSIEIFNPLENTHLPPNYINPNEFRTAVSNGPGTPPPSRRASHNDVPNAPQPNRIRYMTMREIKLKKEFYLSLFLRREMIFNDFVYEINHVLGYLRIKSNAYSDLSKVLLNVEFAKEYGVDLGGITRDLLTILGDYFFDESLGIVEIIGDKASLSSNVVNYEILKAFGVYLSLSFHHRVPLPVQGTSFFYSIMNGKPFNLDHEKNQYSSLLNLNTEYLVQVGERKFNFTPENKIEMFNSFIEYKFITSTWYNLQLIREGFGRLVDHSWEDIANVMDREIEISIERWESITAYENVPEEIATWFWELMCEYPDLVPRVLKFATGARSLKQIDYFSIQGGGSDVFLPSAHSCANQLYLPTYKTKEQMLMKMNMALEEGHGFQFE